MLAEATVQGETKGRLTQRRAAKLLDVSHYTLCKVLRGKISSKRLLARYNELLEAFNKGELADGKYSDAQIFRIGLASRILNVPCAELHDVLAGVTYDTEIIDRFRMFARLWKEALMSEEFDRLETWADEQGVQVEPAISELPSVPMPDTPAAWFRAKFPKLEPKCGQAVEEFRPQEESKRPYVRDVAEDFLAATLGDEGTPEAPVVFSAVEGRFYEYSPGEGIFCEAREAVLMKRLSALLLECARSCQGSFDMSTMEFKFRDTGNLRGVIARARGALEVGPDYFQGDLNEVVPCKNGMLRIADRELLPFSPAYRRRNKLGVPYEAGTPCPMFLGTLLEPALEPDAIDLLQRWCGLALVGVNLAQRFVILTGTAGGGKGAFIRVLTGIIGAANVGTLRPDLLGERFELGRLLDKSLLYGADVPDNFLNCKGASTLKALTGGDPVDVEFKGSNERPQITCRFNAIVTCNSRLTVHLEGDAEAWRRRLAIIEYYKPKTQTPIADLSEQILAKEGPGVLNWMLDGLDKVKRDGWQLVLSEAQQTVVDDLLSESEGDVVFVKECLERDGTESLTVPDAFEQYVTFCNERGWVPIPRKRFSQAICDTVARVFGMSARNDIVGAGGKAQRGWKGIKCK